MGGQRRHAAATTSYNFTNPRRCSYHTDRVRCRLRRAAARYQRHLRAGRRRPPHRAERQAARPARRGEPGELPAPGGQGARGDQHHRRRRDVAGGGRELDQALRRSHRRPRRCRQGPRRRAQALVQELNAHWAAAHPATRRRWAYVPSPRPEALPTVAEQDAIRSAFIYNPSKVETVGRSQVLVNSAAFRNAASRWPRRSSRWRRPRGRVRVIVNHFKSKGGPDAPATVNGDNVDNGTAPATTTVTASARRPRWWPSPTSSRPTRTSSRCSSPVTSTPTRGGPGPGHRGGWVSRT